MTGSVPVAARSAETDRLTVERIDELIERRLATEGVPPAPPADDAEFLRRISLDLCGRIPRAAEVRDFLADASPDKRARKVDELLGSPTYIVNFTNVWRAVMLPEADADPMVRVFLPGFEAWLRSRFAENRNMRAIVHEMLTLPVTPQDVRSFSQPEEPTPIAFYRAKGGRPETLAASTARIFLGLRLDCAQCHDHPFDSWSQDAFWGYAAFFQGIDPNATDRQPGRIKVPDTDRTVAATFLTGLAPEWNGTLDGREMLADWIVDPGNPYFARSAVNRLWAHLFGVGLVDPPDDFSDLNPPSHPQLLELLADEFVASDYDLQHIIRLITATDAYQRTSAQTDLGQQRRQLFAKMAVKALRPEQIFDSLAVATGYQRPFNPEEPLNFNNDPARQEFIETFTDDSEAAVDRQATILQALTLMNGSFVANATGLEDSRTLTAIAEAPFLDSTEQVDALFLTTLSRRPSPAEEEHFVDYINGKTTSADRQQALGDIFWALLNSSEFLLNH